MNKILLVDDDWEFIFLLKELFDMEGFNVLVVYDGEQVLVFLDDSVDLLLFDVMMLKKNGIDMLKELCQIYQILVIMLIVCGSELDCVFGFELGVDDYLFKLFNDCELVVCICVILCCFYWSEQQQMIEVGLLILEVDVLSFNLGCQEVNFDGQMLEFIGIEFILFYLLVQYFGQVVFCEYLSQEVLGKCLMLFDCVIDMYIFNLWCKLLECKDGYLWFKMLCGCGYLMVFVL